MRALIALFAVAACMSAMAGGNDEDKSMKSADAKFEKLDRNQDRQLSKTEAQQDETLSAEFASIDQDSDGYVSQSEYSARMDREKSSDSSWPERSRY